MTPDAGSMRRDPYRGAVIRVMHIVKVTTLSHGSVA
jgi:hypothetical protein